MSRAPSPKSIHGQSVTQQQFLNAIVETLDGLGGGRMQDIVKALGAEWDTHEGRQQINQTLVNMSRRGTIRRMEGERGLYEVTTYGRRAGVSVFDRQEKDILDVIRSHGGFCRLRDILEAFDVRPVGAERKEVRNDPVYVRIMQVIRRSTVIRQDHIKRGVYNLPWGETHALPLRGRWAGMIFESGLYAAKGPNGEPLKREAWEEERDLFFANVGGAFKVLREGRGLTAEEFAGDPAILASLCELQRQAPNEVAIVRGAWMDRIEIERRKMTEVGKPVDEINAWIERETDRMEPALTRSLYSRFEKGAVGAHYHAPLSLYVNAAKFYDVCPVTLSRGIIAGLPPEERLRPAQANYLT
jgi:hypothetical protein